MKAEHDGATAAEDAAVGSVEDLESSVDFMALFYCHLTSCPPHGPFRYYAAMTLVARARRRFGAPCSGDRGAEGSSGYASWSVEAMGADGTVAVLRALTVPNVLSLIERRYNTSHLSSWPLLYVPAEIRGTDVDALLLQQEASRASPLLPS
ncbi:hypothetical protein NESM_000540400 [Novymonas esmeraldas]|uniref:Uncharacterized protein n=1 Tax=Novymonas esmeraldas TaxID=1808958 RepID=A0AAW0EPH6_9TRYP